VQEPSRHRLPACYPTPSPRSANLGIKLREAATGPAWSVNAQAADSFVEKLKAADPALAPRPPTAYREVRTAPTLVKYAQPSEYEIKTRADLTQAAADLLAMCPSTTRPLLTWWNARNRLKWELAQHSFTQPATTLTVRFATLSQKCPRRALPKSSTWPAPIAGKHDELLRAFHAGAALRFDILMDIGGFRDMHRHRRCTQIIQGFYCQARV